VQKRTTMSICLYKRVPQHQKPSGILQRKERKRIGSNLVAE
jgi:hypothetical protein